MSLSVGIVGLPNSGKSTLFNALLKRQIAQVAEYPFTTIEPNTGVVEVPDERLAKISQVTGITKIVPAAIKFIDIAGLVKGANEGEGLGNNFLAHIRETDAILHVVRVFENEKVSHPHGKIDPKYDIEIVNTELELAEIKKPMIYVLNINENQLADAVIEDARAWSLTSSLEGKKVLTICAKLEMELSELTPGEQSQYLKELEVRESGLDKVIKESYGLLHLITFFTIAKGTQIQAWPIKSGSTALEAASMVHTDMAKGFIKAEVVNWQELVSSGLWQAAHEKGKVRLEGKDYQVQDGDVIEFKFHS
ncbi:YchF family ATPase [Candidatus Gottesmanbacteria bacterium]|nr:YchF family ATPase [Candidatus Gottesmanbacteria bacterium]